jgi:hypothetical protein
MRGLCGARCCALIVGERDGNAALRIVTTLTCMCVFCTNWWLMLMLLYISLVP